MTHEYDVFICHASEDKNDFVREFVEELQRRNYRVWYDEFSLKIGDSLRRSIDKGLEKSRYGIVVLSPNFFEKSWTQIELDGLVQKEIGGQKVILPIWHCVSREEVAKYSLTLADKLAALTSEGLNSIVNKIIDVLNSQEFHQPKLKGENPFEYGSSVSPQRFYGRKKEISEVKNRIGAISPQCINLVGLRRNGKSSLLRYIKERISEFCSRKQNPLVVDLDLTNGNFHTPEGILEGLRRGIHRLTENYPWSREDNKDGYLVQDGLQALVDKGYRLIILLDEFEAIAGTKGRLELFQDWGEDWRSKASAGLLTMVIASKCPLTEVYQTLRLTSPFANIFSTTILGSLEEGACQNIIQKGFPPDSAILEWVDELAGALPYYVQMAGAMLWQYENKEIAKEEFILQAQDRFNELWKDLNEDEQLALRYESGKNILPSPDPAIVGRLQRHGLLRKNGGLFSDVFAEFVKNQDKAKN